jgi:hypothetical protein
MDEKYDLFCISKHFQIDGDFEYAERLGNGRINDTFTVCYNCGGRATRYVIQRINHNVFKDPLKLMNNLVRITAHIRAKIKSAGLGDVDRRCLSLISTRANGNYHLSEKGDYWRAFRFIENARTYDFSLRPQRTYEAAKAFGLFQAQLEDFPVQELSEAIPDFHNTAKRFDALCKAVDTDIAGRANIAQKEIEFALGKKIIADTLTGCSQAEDIKQRAVHNDTKLSNAMIDDETGEGICVIDLDTVGPGLVHYDFGDLVRSATCPAVEGETDLGKIDIKVEMFEAAARGYLSHARRFLTNAEIEYLPFSGKLLSFETGIRFLTDYLEGDRYFKTASERENLDRCRTQFKLVESFERHENEMYKCVMSL